jgi:hypothetical protein
MATTSPDGEQGEAMTDEQDERELDDTSAEIVAEQALEQRPIPFMGDDLAAARTAEGAIYVTLPGMCRALGLNAQAQYRRIGRTSTLAKGLRAIPLDTGSGVKATYCLRVDRVALWLGGIETSRIKPAYRAKIEAYQDELAPIAMQVFMRSLGVQPAPQPSTAPAVTNAEIAEIRSQIETLYGVANLLQEHLAGLLSLPGQVAGLNDQMGQALAMLTALAERQQSAESQIERIDERTQRLAPAHARAVQEQITRMVQDTKRLADPLTYTIIYGRLKHHWRVSTYKEIADEQYPAVMAYLQDELRRVLAGEGPAQQGLF